MKKHSDTQTHIKKTPGDIAVNIIIIAFFTAFTLLCIFPFYYLFINTVSEKSAVETGRVTIYPLKLEDDTEKNAETDAVSEEDALKASSFQEKNYTFGINFSNYEKIFKDDSFLKSLLITTARTVIGTLLMVIASAWAGYLVTKQKMWKRRFWYRALVITMYFNAGLVPWYVNMMMLNLTNNFLAYIIPGMIAPYNIILVKTYIESIPTALEESAIIDGASTPKVFIKIIWPLSIPILATIAIFGAVGNWNSFQDSLLLMSGNSDLRTLQHVLYDYLNKNQAGLKAAAESGGNASQALESQSSGVVLQYTISMVSIVPILLVYPFMQRYFVKGIMLGAVKG